MKKPNQTIHSLVAAAFVLLLGAAPAVQAEAAPAAGKVKKEAQ